MKMPKTSYVKSYLHTIIILINIVAFILISIGIFSKCWFNVNYQIIIDDEDNDYHTCLGNVYNIMQSTIDYGKEVNIFIFPVSLIFTCLHVSYILLTVTIILHVIFIIFYSVRTTRTSLSTCLKLKSLILSENVRSYNFNDSNNRKEYSSNSFNSYKSIFDCIFLILYTTSILLGLISSNLITNYCLIDHYGKYYCIYQIIQSNTTIERYDQTDIKILDGTTGLDYLLTICGYCLLMLTVISIMGLLGINNNYTKEKVKLSTEAENVLCE